MYRHPRDLQVPRYNSKRLNNFGCYDSKSSDPQSAQEIYKSNRHNANATKLGRRNAQKRINFEKQNFLCEQHRNACELNSDGRNKSAQSSSILSGNSSHNYKGSLDFKLPRRARACQNSNESISLVGQELDPIIKFLLNNHNQPIIKPMSLPIMKKQQKSQNQPISFIYCQANIQNSHLPGPNTASEPSSPLLSSPELLQTLRIKMIQNLVMLFMRIHKLLLSQLEVPSYELGILTSLIPIQVEKIHLISTYLRRILDKNDTA